MKIRFESDNGLPLNKIMNVLVCVIIARSVFEEKNRKFHPQVYLHSCCLEYDHNTNSYACCEKVMNNSKYGEYLLKKCVANFVATDFNSL